MKKFFSLFLGLVVALSVVAADAPQLNNRKVAKGKAAQFQKAQQKKQKQAPLKLKLEDEPASIVNIACTNLAVEDFYGLLYIMTASNDEYEIDAYLYPEESLYDEYTSELDNISMYITDLATDEELTVSVQEGVLSNDNGNLKFVGVAIDENNVQYNLDLAFVIPEVKDTIDLKFDTIDVELMYYNESGDFYLSAQNEDGWFVGLDFFANELKGTLATEDFDDYYTFMSYTDEEGEDVELAFYSIEAEITPTEDGALIEVGFFATDANYYRFTIVYVKPQAEQTVDLTLTDVTIIDKYFADYGFTAVQAASEDSAIVVTLSVNGELNNGTYTLDDLYTGNTFIKVAADQTSYGILEAEFTITNTEELLKVEGSFLAQNKVLYNLVIEKEIIPLVAKDTVTINFTEPASKLFYDDTKDYYFYAAEGNYIVTLDIFTEDLPGTYTTEDFDSKYTGLYIVNGTDTTSYEIREIEATIEEEGTVGTVTASFLATDSVFYNVTLNYNIVIEEDTVQLLITTDVKLYDFAADYGEFQVIGYSEDGNYGVTLNIQSSSLEGEFTVDDLLAQGQYTILMTPNGFYTFEEGTITSKYEGDDLVVEAELLATNGIVYQIKIVYSTTALINVSNLSKYNTEKVMENGVIYIIKNGVKYNTLGIVVE